MVVNMDNELLLYRRQFILSSDGIDGFPHWQTGLVADRYHLAVHPELGLYQLKTGDAELTLLGFIIDPERPDLGDEELLGDLLDKAVDRDALFRATDSFSGRWIIFYYNGVDLIAFHDPCGLRSLYFTNPRTAPFMCASQPGLISSKLGLSYSEEARSDYLETRAYRELTEYWLPGGATLYEEMVHLRANHYVDIEARTQHRYWPWAKIEPLAYEDGVVRISEMLENSLIAASKRFPLALPLTAGYDTRLLLAASRKLRDEMFYYTLAYWHWDDTSADVAVPHKLVTSLGLEHHILDCHAPMTEEYKRIYHTNVELAHPVWGDIAYGMQDQYPQERVAVKGSCSEISRCHHYKYEYPDVIDGRRLTMFAKMQGSPFVERHMGRWLEQSWDIAKQNRVEILDLFYWEHRMGSWQPMSQLEWDIVQEEFTPFASRKMHTLLMGVDDRHRKPPSYRLYRDMMLRLWPEVLNEPINPKPFWAKMRKEYPRLLRATPVFQYGRKLYSQLFKRSGNHDLPH
jgi:hypothetical protein